MKNISTYLLQIADYIQNRALQGETKKKIPVIAGFGQVAWIFISFIYEVG